MLAAILAGGASTRMGTDKALVEIGGVPMLEHVARAVKAVTTDIFIVGRSGTVLGYPSVADNGVPHQGPLSGVVAALRHAGGPILAVAVDQPFLEPRVLEALAARFDGRHPVVPLDAGILQVTCAIYPWQFFAIAQRHLRAGHSLRQAVLDSDHLAWVDWPGDGRSWLSVDTPEGVDDAVRRFGHPPM